MNKIFFLAIILFLVSLSCNEQEEMRYTTSATIFLINETSVVVRSDNILGYVIQPGETIVHKETYTTEYINKPSIDNYNPFSKSNSLFVYGNNSQCEYGLNKIENYENKKEIAPLEFEFTFRFTENKRENAEPCNLKGLNILNTCTAYKIKTINNYSNKKEA